MNIELLLFPEDQLVQELGQRNRSGLGPDLLVVEGNTARKLHQLGLTRGVRFPDPVTDQVDPLILEQVRLNDGQLAGLPLGLQPQLACFDRRQVGRSPATLEELLQASAQGQRLGFSSDILNLAWTLGGLGALDGTVSLLAGEPVTPKIRGKIAGWLLWLRNADLQQRISFARSQEQLLADLRNGELDWITCRSNHISTLRRAMGPRLGIAALPEGPGGQASPMSRLRVMAFGPNSTPRQREAAAELAVFALNPQMQRTITLRTREMLPVNRTVPVPVASSADLAALVASQAQSDSSDARKLTAYVDIGLRGAVDRILTRFLYGTLDMPTATDALIDALRRGGRS